MRKAPPPTPPSLEKRAQPGRLRAIILAVLVHGAFFALIVFGVSWQSRPTGPLQAEIWDKLPPAKTKAPEPPPAEPPKPEPKPEPPKPEPPKPEPPKPEPPPPPPPPPKAEPPKPDPAIAEKAERLKKEKERQESLEREKREKLEKLEKQKKEEAAKKKREQEEAAKRKKEEEAKRKKEEEERARQEKERQLAREAAAKAQQAEIDSWRAKIAKKVRDRANIPDNVVGHPRAEFRVRILPGGEVLDVTLVKSSGNRAYDSAIERGIRSASPLPVPPANSELFPQFREPNLIFEHDR